MNISITSDEIVEARSLREKGMSYQKIGNSIGHSYGVVYRSLNPEQAERGRGYCRAYHKAHREERRTYCKQWHEENKESDLDYSAGYRATHKDKKSAYYKDHKADYLAHNAVRRAIIKGAMAEATEAVLTEMREIYRRARRDIDARCYICGELIMVGQRHVDHVIPLAKGGKHEPSNLAIAHKTCNLRKWTNVLPQAQIEHA